MKQSLFKTLGAALDRSRNGVIHGEPYAFRKCAQDVLRLLYVLLHDINKPDSFLFKNILYIKTGARIGDNFDQMRTQTPLSLLLRMSSEFLPCIEASHLHKAKFSVNNAVNPRRPYEVAQLSSLIDMMRNLNEKNKGAIKKLSDHATEMAKHGEGSKGNLRSIYDANEEARKSREFVDMLRSSKYIEIWGTGSYETDDYFNTPVTVKGDSTDKLTAGFDGYSDAKVTSIEKWRIFIKIGLHDVVIKSMNIELDD